MNTATNPHQQALAAAIARIRTRLENPEAVLPEHSPLSGEASGLDILTTGFRLTPFERDLLVLAAAPDLDGPCAELLVKAGADPRRPAATFSIALRVLDSPHWSAFPPSAALRRWRLLDVASADPIMHSPLRVDERVLHFLMGAPAEDDRISALLQPLPEAGALAPGQLEAGMSANAALAERPRPLVQLCGAVAETRLVAARVMHTAGLRGAVITAANVPASPAEREAVARLMEREMVFSSLVPVLDLHGADAAETARTLHFAACIEAPALILSREPVNLDRPTVVCEVPRASAPAQRELWHAALGVRAAGLNGSLDRVVRQFDFDAAHIARTAARFAASAGTPDDLWKLCRDAARPRVESLARRFDCRSGWDDLVLPAAQIATLRELAAQAANRYTVYEEWGFAASSGRGLGLTALFSGPSGTGKTLAAEVIAAELQLDLYRIDLSATVSKWLGETEKNLARIFDAAEAGGAILLFDEADALFGKRSEVKDSRDRYANVEVSYLLQRMEAYRGLAILTTNQREALDTAFLRRLRFVVTFPLPDASHRQSIWQRAFPAATPVDGLRPDKLARLSVTGGAIRNIAINAAFAAAAERQPVRMSHLLAAARGEAAKSDRPVNTSEVADWA
ncbi:MAG: ATP-binding protein [Verrucomicrobia bacterium]|nr:ATP-binding protein [Verrucomicrobiota bacterium]